MIRGCGTCPTPRCHVLSSKDPLLNLPSKSPVVTCRDVSFSYGKRPVFDGLNATLGPGLCFVVGRNGVGKTTLFGLIRGRLSGSGEVRASVDTRLCPLDDIGYLPQSFSVPAGLTAREFVEYVAWIRGMRRKQIGGAAAAALEQVGLTERADDRLAVLSGGMIRRVGIAQAIVTGSKLLLLDEPTVGLDPIQRVQLRSTLRRLAQDMTVVVSTHLLDDVDGESVDLVVLNEGRATFNGTVAELRSRLHDTEAGELGPLSVEALFLRLHGEEIS